MSNNGAAHSATAMAENLRAALEAGDVNRVLHLLKMGAPIVVDAGGDGQTALHIAAASGNLDMVEALIQAGCDVGMQDFTGHTALQRASAEGHLEIIKTLVKNGVSVDHQDEAHGNTALHESTWKGFSQSVHFLCKSKANPYIKNRGGFAPLHLCCQNGHNETCRVILLSGCKPDIKNNYGDTPLHTASRYGHAGVIRILVSAKCNTSEQNKNGDTALHIAAAMGRRKLTRVLLESGCDPRVRNKQGETAEDIAARKRLVDIVQILRNPPRLLNAHEKYALDQTLSNNNNTSGNNIHNGHNRHDMVGKSVDDSGDEDDDDDVDAIRAAPLIDDHHHHHHNAKKHKEARVSSSKRKKSKERGSNGERRRQRRHHRSHDSFDNLYMHHQIDHHGEQQYFMDLAGNIRKGPAISNRRHCACGPAFQKFERKLDLDKRDLIKAIDHSHMRLDSRLNHLERRTRDQLFGLNQAMKESFAQERGECMDRMDRRALRERVAIERQQLLRDLALKRDLALWLDAKLGEIEKRHQLDAKNSALLRAMAVKRFSKYTRSTKKMFEEQMAIGTLRRAHSEEIISEVGEDISNNSQAKSKGRKRLFEDTDLARLKVSDRPQRTRRNSAGDEVSSILERETSNDLKALDMGFVGERPLTVGGEEPPQSYSRQHHRPQLYFDSTLGDSYASSTVTAASSSLNTTVVEKYVPSPEQRLDFVVCDRGADGCSSNNSLQTPSPPGPTNEAQNEYDFRPGIIRPIPGRPGESKPAPPIPGPKPAYFEPYTNNNDDHNSLGLPPPASATQMMMKPQFSTFGYGFGFKSMKPMLAPLEEVDYTSAEQLEQEMNEANSQQSTASSANHSPPINNQPQQAQSKMLDFHRQLLNLPLNSAEGSHDSHNDSGYSTRLGFSAGPSPSLSGSRPESSEGDHPQYQNTAGNNNHLLDPMAICLMPPEFEKPGLGLTMEQRQHALMEATSSKIEEVQKQLELLMNSSDAPHDGTVEGFGPKGSLV